VDRTERGAMLIELISEKQRKDKQEQADETTDATAVLQTDDSQGSPMEKDSPRKVVMFVNWTSYFFIPSHSLINLQVLPFRSTPVSYQT